MKKYLTMYEFAKLVNRAQPTIRGHIERGNVKMVEVTENVKRIPYTEVKKFLGKYPFNL